MKVLLADMLKKLVKSWLSDRDTERPQRLIGVEGDNTNIDG
jgi:hypothetical protein